MKTTTKHADYWRNRNIDWDKHYTATWDHPHRDLIIDKLKKWTWISLLEIGCASGPNLYRIRREFPSNIKQLGGIDINEAAIREARVVDRNLALQIDKERAITMNQDEVNLILTIFPNFKSKVSQFSKPWFLETRDISKEGVFMSDRGLDIVLTDMTLIYISPWKIKKVLKEIKRITRFHILFVEFHSKSWWQRFKLWWQRGYFAHDWQKLLEETGFNDILIEKIPEHMWQGGEPQKSYGYVISAHV